MFTKLPKYKSKLVALMLCLWLSGAFCVLNCDFTEVLAAESGNVAQVEDESLPACHRKAAKRETSETSDDESGNLLKEKPSSIPMMSCCPFFNLSVEPGKNFSFTAARLSAAQVEFPLPILLVKRKYAVQINYKPPKTRGETYLLNCVFLI